MATTQSMSLEASVPPQKKPRLSLSLSEKEKGRPIITGERFELVNAAVKSAKKPIVPSNTQKAMKWALRAFQDWLSRQIK